MNMDRKGFLQATLCTAGFGFLAGARRSPAGTVSAESAERPGNRGVVDVRSLGVSPGTVSTDALQRGLDTLPDGVTVLFTSDATGSAVYRIDRTLRLAGRSRIRIAAESGARIELVGPRHSLLDAEDCEDLCVDGLDAFSEAGPGGNPLHNKVLLALRCPRVRIERCRAQGLVLCYLRACHDAVVWGNRCDTGIDASQHTRASGFNYGVHLRGCRHARVESNVIRNCVNDGIKTASHREESAEAGRVYGSETIIAGNFVSGCVNDDAIDTFNSGERVILAHNILTNNQKGMNLKRGRDPLNVVQETIVANNIVVGGEWNRDLSALQIGITVDSRDLIAQGNLVSDIEGVGYLFGGAAAHVQVLNGIVENIRRRPEWERMDRELSGVGIADIIRPGETTANPSFTGGDEEAMPMRNGPMTFAHCMIRNCETWGMVLRSSSRGIVQGCVFEDMGAGGLLVDHRVAGAAPMSVHACRFLNPGRAGSDAALRFTAAVTAPAFVSHCAVEDGFAKPFADETEGRLVRDTLNSWNRDRGSSGLRPTENARVGDVYFDTTLGRPLWWSGVAWIDAAGAPV